MPLIPIVGKLSKKNFPYVTTALILANILVFFIFQGGDAARMDSAQRHYLESGLGRIELAYYAEYGKGEVREPDVEELLNAPSKGEMKKNDPRKFAEMFRDEKFQTLLREGKIVLPGDVLYEKWRGLRTEFEAVRAQTTTQRFGLIPAHPQWYAFFTCMFLHGGFGHLFGNMLFLWLVGSFLETGCGKIYYMVLLPPVGSCGCRGLCAYLSRRAGAPGGGFRCYCRGYGGVCGSLREEESQYLCFSRILLRVPFHPGLLDASGMARK